MLRSAEFCSLLRSRGIEFFTGVPDSLMESFCLSLVEQCPPERHVIAANEGNAVATAAGYHLATGKIALVYLQNSGMGNCVNPLISLADPAVYSIPMLLLIGWRGEPGKADEPQHRTQGKITRTLLKTLGVAHAVLPGENTAALRTLQRALQTIRRTSRPYALVVRAGTFERPIVSVRRSAYSMTREEALQIVLSGLGARDVIVSTTGKLSRELSELRRGRSTAGDFLTVGSMGHASSIALGIALARPKRHVYCLDGDGAAIMHLGALAVIGQKQAPRYHHILFNNGMHDSVGGQPTAGFFADLSRVAQACGYRRVKRVETPDDLRSAVRAQKRGEGPSFLEIRLRPGSRSDLGRPDDALLRRKQGFMRHLRSRA